MCRFYELLNVDLQPFHSNRKRRWLKAGQPTIIRQRVILTAYFDLHDNQYLPRVVVMTPGKKLEYDLPMSTYLDLSSWTGMMALPRAVEWNDRAKPLRLLMEFSPIIEDLKKHNQ